MELTVQNVYGLLLRSRLMSIDDAKALFARWEKEAKDSSGNLSQFSAWVVDNKYLTEYQMRLLARGHAEGFFLNEYKILDRLGKGRMAGVYKAQHQLGQIVAVKVLPPSKAQDATLLRRFHREARLCLRLKHPNIVRSFQTGCADGLYYIVMEFLEGETVDDVLARRGKLPPGEAVRLVHQALQGLQHMHLQGLVHRDLKPANMMLVGSQSDSTLGATLKILDIGLGRTLFDETAGEFGDNELTSEGVLLGTPDYMSPEQARDPRTTDIRSDIYSVGCVLYHLMSGQPPFPDTNIISQMIRHATEAPKPLKLFNPAVPDGLQQILNWMMAKDAAQRYPSPERAAQALQVFLAAGNEQLAVPEADPRMRPYLTWLEDSAPIPSAPVRSPATEENEKPAKVSNRDSVSASGERKAKPRESKEKHVTKKHRIPAEAAFQVDPERARGTNAPPTAAAPVQKMDVELVPLDQLGKDFQLFWGLRLSRREMIVFGIGAVLGAVVTFIGALLAFRHRE